MSTLQKALPSWLTAAAHYLVGGFVLPYVISMAIMLVLAPLLYFFAIWLSPVATLVGVWVGAMLSARLINKFFSISDSNKVIRIATVYYVLFSLAYLVTAFGSAMLLFHVANAVVGSIAFYVASKKFLRSGAAV